MALYNATKKQYGLHIHLLAVSLQPPEAPVAAPSLLPELPLSPLPDATFSKPPPEGTQHLNLSPEDVKQFARFVREFTTMSLVPWMERCVGEWNETVSWIHSCGMYCILTSSSMLRPVAFPRDSSPQPEDYLEALQLQLHLRPIQRMVMLRQHRLEQLHRLQHRHLGPPRPNSDVLPNLPHSLEMSSWRLWYGNLCERKGKADR